VTRRADRQRFVVIAALIDLPAIARGDAQSIISFSLIFCVVFLGEAPIVVLRA
jgi:hypothetical protein